MWDNFLALLDEDLNEEENSIAQLSLNLISSRLSSEVTVVGSVRVVYSKNPQLRSCIFPS